MSELNFEEAQGAFQVTHTWNRSLVDRAMSGITSGAILLIGASLTVGVGVLAVVASVAVTLLAFWYAGRTRRFSLTVTQGEFTARGRVGDEFGSVRRIQASEVLGLEFQPDSSGPETSHHPQGLYAVLRHRSVCIMPEIDEQAVALVIEKIHGRFPHFQDQWKNRPGLGGHFIGLGLND